MKTNRVTVGTGMTARLRTVRSAESIVDAQRLMDELNGAWQDYPDHVSEIEKQAVAYLASQELPNAFGLWNCRSGKWRVSDRPLRRQTKHYDLVTAVIDISGHAEDSPAGYAARILVLARRWRAAADGGDVARASQWAHDLGALVTDANLKRAWEVSAMRGRGTVESASKGGKMRAAKFKPRNEGIAARYKDLQREKTPKPIETIGDEFNLKRSAVYEILKTSRK